MMRFIRATRRPLLAHPSRTEPEPERALRVHKRPMAYDVRGPDGPICNLLGNSNSGLKITRRPRPDATRRLALSVGRCQPSAAPRVRSANAPRDSGRPQSEYAGPRRCRPKRRTVEPLLRASDRHESQRPRGALTAQGWRSAVPADGPGRNAASPALPRDRPVVVGRRHRAGLWCTDRAVAVS
jgi:hypothetical protein